MTVAHAAGCSTIDASGFTKFLTDYPWVMGAIFILFGPIIGMVGKRFFPWIVAILASVLVLLGFLILFSVIGWMEETLGFWLSIVSAAILAGLTMYFTKKAIWFEVGLLGCIGGYFAGTVLYGIIVAACGYDELWFYIVIEAVCVILVGLLSCKWGQAVVIASTSFIGSYLFFRGWSYICGGWPTE